MAVQPLESGSASVNVADILAYAKMQLGKPYQWGAAGPNAFDCSGLVVDTFHHLGIDLPRTSQQQAKVGTPIATNQIAAGDLVFSNWGDGPNSHVGIATSAGQIIDAPHTGAFVRYDTLSPGYISHVTAVRRVTGTYGQSGITGRGTEVGGAGGGGGLFDPIIQPFTDLAAAAGQVGRFADLLSKLALPSTFVRVAAGLGGAIFVFLGVWLLTKEVRRE